MTAQSWIVIVEKDYGHHEKHSVFAPNPDNVRKQLERRGYKVVEVKEGHFYQNVNSSAEFRNI